MKKKAELIDVNILNINPDVIRAAASNVLRVQDMALEIPVVDPRDLSVDDQIFGVELHPIKKDAPVGPSSALHVAIKPIVVEVLSGRSKPNYITVNGTIDIPREPGKVVKLTDCYFVSQMDARAVCRVITEVELERSLERSKLEEENQTFYKNQVTNDRY